MRAMMLCVVGVVACSPEAARDVAPPEVGSSAGASSGTSGVGAAAGSGAGAGGLGGMIQGGASGSAGGGIGGSSNGGAGTGAGATGGASGSCGAATYAICEDFESTDLGAPPEGWTKHGEASGVDDSEARHGQRSLKLGAIPVWERRIHHDATMLGASHWGRIYYKVGLPVPDAFVHSTLVAFGGEGPTSGSGEFRVVDTVKTAGAGASHQFLYNVQPQNGGEFGATTGYDWTFDGEWHCAEWFVDATTQSFRFYFDGAEALTIENGSGNYANTDLPSSFSELRVGWINYQEAPPGFTAWIDDVAVGDERIGCED